MPSSAALLSGLSFAAVAGGVRLLESGLSQPPSRGKFSTTCKPYPGKRVVMVSVNQEFFDIFLNWLYFATRFLDSTEHLAVFAEDRKVLGGLKQELGKKNIEFTIFEPPNENPDLAKGVLPDGASFSRGPPYSIFANGPWGSREYREIVWRRPHYMLQMVNQGCTLLYADIDSVWAKDPFLDIGERPGYPMYLISDLPWQQTCPGYACSCFMYLQPTKEVRKVLEMWCSYENPGLPNNQPSLHQALEVLKPNVTCLPREKFPIGVQVGRLDNVTVVHANYMDGHDSKTCFLSKHRMWKGSRGPAMPKKNCTIQWTKR